VELRPVAMGMDDPKIVALREMVTAAQQEFDMATTFHEIWKPAAYDQDLHCRLGKSLASQVFLVTRAALRREMLLALIRLWDKDKRAIRMQSIWSTLREKEVIDALALDRVNHLGLPEAIAEMRDDLGKKATDAIHLISKYMDGGARRALLEKLLTLRHERLAHRQLGSGRMAKSGAGSHTEALQGSRLLRVG
jgi:hypothetical protein